MEVKPKILLLIDDSSRSGDIASELNSHGYEVVECAEDRQLKDIMTGAKFNVAVSYAASEPGKSIRIVKAIRRRRKLLPIIAITDDETEGEKSDLLKAGADSVVLITGSPEPLTTALDFYCSLSRGIQKHIGEDSEDSGEQQAQDKDSDVNLN